MATTLTVLGYSDLEGVYDDPVRVARLARRIRASRDGATLVVGAGDDTALGVAATVSTHRDGVDLPVPGGRALAVPFLRAVDPDAETFGNHDLDHGPGATLSTVAELPGLWTCANLRDGDGHFGADAGVRRSRLIETDAGTVGVFGVTTERLTGITPNAADLTVADPVETARRVAADLRENAEYVVGLSHCGVVDPDVAAAADADLVLGGHRHDRHAGVHDGTLLVRTGGEGIVEATPDCEYAFRDASDAPPDRDLLETYARVRRSLGLAETVAHLDAPVERDEDLLTSRECRSGNFCADAYRAATDADLGLLHTGSLRAGPTLSGAVTVADVISLSPFGNRLTTLTLSGAALRDALASLCPAADSERWFLALSGGRVAWHHDEERFETLTVDGDPVVDDATYTVATQEYVVAYDGMPTVTPETVDGYHGLQYDALVEHARNGGLTVDCEDRVRDVGE